MAAALTDVEVREAAHWNDVARTLGDEHLSTLTIGTADADRRRIELCGDLREARVLDVGCGSGEWAVYLAQRGARVWAIDISPEMVAVTQRRADLFGLSDRVIALEMSALRLLFDDGFFDVVHGQDIIHHLPPDAFGKEIARVLRPGGRAVFRENSAENPLLMLARNTLCGRFGISKWSSDDEYPLTRTNRQRFSQHFSRLHVEHPEFLAFHYVDAKLFRYKNRLATRACRLADKACYRVAPLRRFSYRQLLQCTR